MNLSLWLLVGFGGSFGKLKKISQRIFVLGAAKQSRIAAIENHGMYAVAGPEQASSLFYTYHLSSFLNSLK